MSRIIVIGEADLRIGFDGLTPLSARPGGRMLNLAAELSRRGHDVVFASEVGNDAVGDLIVHYLDSEGVDTRSIERSVTMMTPATLTFGDMPPVRYDRCDSESDGFDIVWPEVERARTVVVFGGYFAVNQRVRPRLMQLLGYMTDRKCPVIYVPGFDLSRVSRITRVMPMIFENLEIAATVVTQTADILNIFGKADPAAVFRDHFDYYVDRYVNIGDDGVADLFEIGGRTCRFDVKAGGDANAALADAILKIIE